MRKPLVIGVLLAMACSGAQPPRPASTVVAPAPRAAVEPAPVPGAPVAPEPAKSEWLTTLDREHALVGKLWDVKAAAFVEPSLLIPQLASAKFVLLGERHDNPDHHRLQGAVLAELVKAGRRPAVVFEMLEIEQQRAIDEYLARSDASAAGFGAALEWQKTSWPPYSEYQPVFEAAFAGKLPIVAGNLAQGDAKALVKQGISALPGARVKALRLERAFPAALEAPLLDELRASHCGQLPDKLLPAMALAQHARDAQMAQVMVKAAATDGAVLIAGGGHAQLERGVPYYLAFDAPGASIKSLLFREVRHGDTDPKHYATDEGRFDYLWFTPRATDEDPCAAFKK